MNRKKIFEYVKNEFGTVPDYPWKRFPNYAVLRHDNNKKWYGLVMNVPKNKLGLKSSQYVDVLNIKIKPEHSLTLQKNPDIFQAYHMNREHWISIILNGQVSEKEIYALLQQSYDLTN